MAKPSLQAAPRPEFSREVAIEAIGARGYRAAIEADAHECAALAERFGLLAIDGLKAEVALARDERGDIRLAASFEADVVQACVVTLEPVAVHLAERFEQTFSGAAAVSAGTEVVIDPLAEDVPEPLEDDVIEVGELIAQQLALALDPYPRKPGVTVEGRLAELGLSLAAGEPEGERPFAALEALKKGRARRS